MSRLLFMLPALLLVAPAAQAYDYKKMQEQYNSGGGAQDATSYLRQQKSRSNNYDQYDASQFEVQQMMDSGNLDIDRMDQLQGNSHTNQPYVPYSTDLSTPGACPYGMCDRGQ